MALSKLGDYIEQIEQRNTDLKYGVDDVRGVSNTKQFMPTKANNDGRDLVKFYVISPEEFVYNSRTTRMGEKVGLGYNNTDETFLTSWNNSAFRVKKDALQLLSPTYLYMYYNRPEFDRYARYNSWGSSTELFSWGDMCDIDVDLPPIEIQQKHVDVYNAMVLNQKSYEQGLEDLKLTCDAYIDRLRNELPHNELEKYIERQNNKNQDNAISNVLGLSTLKQFRHPNSRVNINMLSNYKIVRDGEFAFVPTTDTWKVFAFGLNRGNGDIVVSPIYEVFSIVNQQKLIPEYLAIWFKRTEFDRYARYHSWGSARENFLYSDLCEVKLPIPKFNVQQSIVDIYKAYLTRREINEKMKTQIKDLCPILIKGSIEEAQKAEAVR